MQELYRIDVTDIAYAYDGTDTFYVTDKIMFDAFAASDRLSKVIVPAEFENDGASEWLYSVDTETVEYPFIVLGETHVWSNC